MSLQNPRSRCNDTVIYNADNQPTYLPSICSKRIIYYSSQLNTQWTDLTWQLAGSLLNQVTQKSHHLRTFLLKFPTHTPNTRHKYSRPHPPLPAHTPLFEAAGTIYKTPTSNSFKITPCHHSSVLSTHPVIHMIQDTSPNCANRPLLIPKPTPHLKLFVITLYNIPPLHHTNYTVRPPPLPLPPPQPPPEPPPSQEPTRLPNERHKMRITDYFRSTNRG